MRVRLVAIAVLATAALAACSSSSSGKGSVQTSPAAGPNSSSSSAPASGSSGSGSSGGGGNATALCAQLGQAQNQIQGLDADISDPAALKTALEKEAGVLASLKANAPADLVGPLDDLATLLKGAEEAVANPASPDISKLEALATQVPADAAKIEAYVEKNCPGVQISASLP